MQKMDSRDFVTKLLRIAEDRKTVYMWGTFGTPVTESAISGKAKQYPSWYTSAKQAALRKFIGRGYFGFDCVGLIKGVFWGWSGNAGATYGGAKYASNSVPDVSADGMLAKLENVSTDFSNITSGEAVWMSGHIGVYAGNGKVVECTPSWENGVQVTACWNIGKITGLNGRKWVKHGKLPYVSYAQKGMTVKEFQKAFGLEVDGIVGPITKAKMKEALGLINQYMKGN